MSSNISFQYQVFYRSVEHCLPSKSIHLADLVNTFLHHRIHRQCLPTISSRISSKRTNPEVPPNSSTTIRMWILISGNLREDHLFFRFRNEKCCRIRIAICKLHLYSGMGEDPWYKGFPAHRQVSRHNRYPWVPGLLMIAAHVRNCCEYYWGDFKPRPHDFIYPFVPNFTILQNLLIIWNIEVSVSWSAFEFHRWRDSFVFKEPFIYKDVE